MNFFVHKPSGFISNFIQEIVYYNNYTAEHLYERLLPDGVQNLVIDLTEKPKYIFDNNTLEKKQKCTNAWISGSRDALLTIDAGGEMSSMMVVSFKYGAAFHFTHFPVSEITGCVVDTDLVFDELVTDLRERILTSETVTKKFQNVELCLSSRLLKEEIPNVIRYSTELLEECPSQRTIQVLSEMSGYSQKHFISLFKKYVGVTPKAFQKIQRFQRVVKDLELSKKVHWAKLALDCGYYDQAHFINEFKTFSGMNPEQYLVEKGPDMNYVPIN